MAIKKLNRSGFLMLILPLLFSCGNSESKKSELEIVENDLSVGNRTDLKILVSNDSMLIFTGNCIFNNVDYVGDQNLGFWSLSKRDVSKSVGSFFDGNYRVIDNQSYKDYRVAANKGGDFYQYSTFSPGKIVDFKFTLIR